jgi:MFS family permease
VDQTIAEKRGSGEGEQGGLTRMAFGLVFSCYFIMSIGNMGLISVLPGIGRLIGLPDPFIAACFSVSGLFLVMASPFWARAADRHGRKPVLLTGMAGYALSMVLCAVVVAAGIHKLAPWFIIAPSLIMARSVFGLVGSAILPSGQAYVAERAPREERTKAISSLAGAQSLGTIIGPLLAPLFILPFVGFSGPMLCFALFAVVTAILVGRHLHEGPRIEFDDDAIADPATEPQAGGVPFWRDGRIMPFVLFAAGMGIAQGAQSQILAFLIIDTLKVSPIQAQGSIALAMMFGAASGLAGQWGLIRLFRMKPKDLMRWGAAIALLGHLMILGSTHFGFIVAGYAASCVGFSFGRPGYTAGMSLAVSQREQGRVAGINAALAGINVLAPLFVVLYQFNRNIPFAINACLIAAALVYCFAKVRLRTSGVAPRPASAAS